MLATLVIASAVAGFISPSHLPPATRAVAAAPAVSMFGGGGEPVEVQIKTFKGVKTAKGAVGKPMIKSLSSAGIVYGCKNGDCGTCEVKMDGRKVRPCVAKLPKKAKVSVDVTSNVLLKSRR